MKRLIVLFLSCFAARAGIACLQTYGTDLEGHRVGFNGLTGQTLVDAVMDHEPRKYWVAQVERLKARAAVAGDFKARNDYAVALIHVGDVYQAMAILRAIEEEHPGRAQTAANLGTGYELLGKNGDALKWIREGIHRNHDEHLGTEWLHVLILQAKIASATDSRFLINHSVAGLDFGVDERPRLRRPYPLNNVGRPASVEQLKTAMEYQLAERLQFIQAPDPIVGDLFFDWGNLLAVTEVVESADAAYAVAERFSPARRELFMKRKQLMRAVLRASAKSAH